MCWCRRVKVKVIQGKYGIGYSCDNAFVSLAKAVLAGFDLICVLVSVQCLLTSADDTCQEMTVFETVLTSPAGCGLWWSLWSLAMSLLCWPSPGQPKGKGAGL